MFHIIRLPSLAAFLAAMVLALISVDVSAAPSRAERRAFDSALQRFQDGLLPEAEKAFTKFFTDYPASELRPESVLQMAKIRFQLGNFTDALGAMKAEEGGAGPLADQYRFLAGECLLKLDRPREAAETFANLLAAFPQSGLRLEAIHSQAVALGRLGDWKGVSALLLAPGSEFTSARSGRAGESAVISGVLLAAEAAMELGEARAVSELLASLPATGLNASDDWRRDLLRTRANVAENRPAEAMLASSNLVAAARRLNSAEAIGQSLLFRAEIFEREGNLALANATLEEVLPLAGVQALRRSALARIVHLALEQGRTEVALARLDRFLSATNAEPVANAARVAVAEVQVRMAFAVASTNAVEATGLRAAALTNLQAAVAADMPLPLLGRAGLTRGWIFWAESNHVAAATNFEAAARLLPPGRDAAVAAFKLGDSLLAEQRWAGALAAYEKLLEDFAAIPEVRTNLFDHANYPALSAAVSAGNLASAEAAFQRLSDAFPKNLFTERAALLLGQAQTRIGQLDRARETFSAFAARFAESKLRDRAELLAARTFEKKRDWPAAARAFGAWTAKYSESPLRPTAEFLLADATFRSTGESNAVPIFTNLMARFPNSPEAPLAQNWIADRSFSRGAYAEALKHFQLLYQSTNCPVDLAREARMMAGRAAFALQEFRDARTHFTELINVINALPLDTNNAPELLGRAYFALGDTIFQQVRDAGTNRTAADFSDAVEAFSKVGRYFAGTALGPAALGRLGQIHFQWALDRKDPKGFDAATNFFTLARDSAVADASTLWEAQHWIGRVLREQGRVDAALEAFTSILYAEEERKPDPLTVMNAGIEAGNILESQNRIAEAIRLYTRLMELEPSSRPAVDKRIEALRQRGAAAGG